MGKLNQVVTGIAVSFGAILMGFVNAWPSYTLELYTTANNTILTSPMTEFEASLVGSMPSLGSLLGTAIAGSVIDSIGRKKGIILLLLPYMVSWLIIKFSSTSTPIVIARGISGVTGGAYWIYASIYISEIAEPSIRGALASASFAIYSIGALMSYLSGWFFSYGEVIWINIALCVLNLVLMSTVVESPLFLLKLKKEQEALQALAHYRSGSMRSVSEELSAMKRQLAPAVQLDCVYADENEKEEDAEKEKLNVDNEVTAEIRKDSAIKLLFTDPASRRAFMVVGTAEVLQVFMGLVPVQVYAGELFSTAAPGLSPDFCSVLLAVILFISCIVSIILVDKAGRRVLIISSSALTATCMGALAGLLQWRVGPAWLAALVLLVYCFCHAYGASSVPFVLLTECFNLKVQGIASMILVQLVWLLNFLMVSVFPYMLSQLGVHGTFYVLAGMAFANALLSHWNIPETKGMSRTQIQELFSKQRRR